MRRSGCHTAPVPPHLRPLLAIVIVLAIAHTLLKVRARVASRRKARAARPVAKAPIVPTDLGELAPDEALARLHDRARRSETRP